MGMHNLSNKWFFCTLLHAACWERPKRVSHPSFSLRSYIVSPELSTNWQRDFVDKKIRSFPEPYKWPRSSGFQSLSAPLSRLRLSSLPSFYFPSKCKGTREHCLWAFRRFFPLRVFFSLPYHSPSSTGHSFQHNWLKSLFTVDWAFICSWVIPDLLLISFSNAFCCLMFERMLKNWWTVFLDKSNLISTRLSF